MGFWKSYQAGGDKDNSNGETPYQNTVMVETEQQPQPQLELPPEPLDEQGNEAGTFTHLNPTDTGYVPLPQLTNREERAHRHLKRLQWLMDESVPLPWSTAENPAKVGIDPIIGLVPVLGDISSAALSLAFVARASPVLSKYTTSRMLVNVGIDATVGIVPIIGDLFDFAFKANTRNMAIFEDHMKRGRRERRETDKKFMFVLLLCFIGFLAFITLIGILFTVLVFMLITGRL